MANDTVSVTFKCSKCGARIVWPDDAVDATKLACVDCGEDAGTYGDLRNAGMEAVKNRIEGIFQEAVKGH